MEKKTINNLAHLALADLRGRFETTISPFYRRRLMKQAHFIREARRKGAAIEMENTKLKAEKI